MKTQEPLNPEKLSLGERQSEMRSRMVRVRCNRKLSIAQESEVRAMRSKGCTLRTIATVFGMSRVGIGFVLRRAKQ